MTAGRRPGGARRGGGLVALVGRVRAAESAADALRENLNELRWVKRVARAHEGVLERALATATVVPLRLCTISIQPRRGMSDKRLHTPPDLERCAVAPRIEGALPGRIDADPERVERGLAQLVLTIVELLRQLMERQALRRIDSGTLTDEQVERLGKTFMELNERMAELREQFGLDAEDLNLDLGPLGRLL